ncbi:MAG: serine/threonine-protein kinase [Planctomycetaceae bacterium]|jgi:serine/threonine protein kinase|nr:serine/threonine-protein kinase [Planctomycetaceae bacterium]
MDLQRIDGLCDEFEAALRKGESAQIEDFLNRADSEHRQRLLSELLEIEIELAAGSGKSDNNRFLLQLQDSFDQRFPEQSELVHSIIRRIVQLRQIGDYEIIEELGHGGMGIVYKARQKLLNQTVAIKVLSQTLLDDSQAVGRFRREMQLIGGLNHPNIVRALNAGENDGIHYLVMEFVDGVTLQRLCDNLQKENECGNGNENKNEDRNKNENENENKSGNNNRFIDETITPVYPVRKLSTGFLSKNYYSAATVSSSVMKPVFPVGAACEAIRQAALGLQHAHEFNLVHRDIKPANLMVDRHGIVKILDLGLGKFLAEQRSSDYNTSLTIAGTTIGTIDYISPEQCESAGDVDIRADLYSLGCTLYFLLTGKPPYTGSRYETTRKKLMAHIIGEVPAVRKIVADIPEKLETVLCKVLAKDPEERFQTPIEFANALQSWASLDSLLNLIDGELPGGVCLTPGSTGKIRGTSDTLQTKAVTKNNILSRRLSISVALKSASIFILTIIVLVFFLFRQHLVPTFSPDRQPVSIDVVQKVNSLQSTNSLQNTTPLQNTTSLQNQQILIQTDLAQLPGLNGSWWFEETPWFLPFVRELLIKKIGETGDLKTIFSDDAEMEKYYDSNIPAVRDWLWNFVQKFHNDLTPSERKLVEKLKEYYDSNIETDSKKFYQKLLDDFLSETNLSDKNLSDKNLPETKLPETKLADKKLSETNLPETTLSESDLSGDKIAKGLEIRSRHGVELHTQALLEHKLANLYHDRERAAVAVKRYEDALEQYRIEFGNGNEISRRLEFLCLSDSARVEYLATGNYVKAIQKFETVSQQRKTGERFSPLFIAELRAAHGTLCSTAGLYDDTLFVRGREVLLRDKERNRMHPLAAYLAEQYAWSLLDQWKVTEAEKQFGEAILIRAANYRESKNPQAHIRFLHDQHGRAMTFRYLGNTDRAVEEYRKTLTLIDEELQKNQEILERSHSSLLLPEVRRSEKGLRERAANTRERLADCTLYGGAASGVGQGRLNEMIRLYEEAAQFYEWTAEIQVMRYKQAIALLLLEKTEEAEQILAELNAQKQRQYQSVTLLRNEWTHQAAEALLAYRKNSHSPTERKRLLRQFLKQFTIPGNPANTDAARRETLELRLFCAELLVNDALDEADFQSLRRDLPLLLQPLGFFMERLGSRPFIRRISDLIVRSSALLYENSTDPAIKQMQLTSIVRLLEGMRLRRESIESATHSVSQTTPSLVVFFLTEEAQDGFVIFYPQDDRYGNLFRLPLTRKQVKDGVKKTNESLRLNEQLLQLLREERNAGRTVNISWNDEASWSRTEDALTDADWLFGEEWDIGNKN